MIHIYNQHDRCEVQFFESEPGKFQKLVISWVKISGYSCKRNDTVVCIKIHEWRPLKFTNALVFYLYYIY